ncbi:MAG: hypothetical protein KC621_25915, partial [Myxococcales bacterium]|nr:hypothetical protein [Myxococcales bacterium]
PATPLVPTWTRNRYRLRPRTDLVTASLVEGVGRVVEDAVSSVSGTRRLTRLLRLRRLEELNAPPVILQNEQRMLDATVDVFGWLGPDDIGAPGTVERARAGLMAVEASTADYAYASSEIGQLFAGLRADLDLARAHDRPVWVLKTDLAAFYPSVSHALVTELLTWLGLDARLVAVVREVLAPPLSDGTRARRGLPLGLTLSRALESLILTLVVAEVRAAAPVRVLRLVDDLVIVADRAEDLSAAWASLRAVVSEGGLALNEGKTGAVCVGGELPPDAPAGGVRWGLLALGADGAWRVDEPAVDAFASLTSERVLAHASLLDRVACWRDQLRWLQTWLAPTADLGPDHLRAVGDAVARLERLGDGTPMATMVRAEVERRFLGGTPGALPDAWLHWPLTAGGLGLPWPAADRVPLELARAERERQSPALPAPVHDPLSDPAWGAWYAHRLAPIAPLEPTSTPEQDDQVKRFVERGTRIGRPGAPLAPYWRWVLHTLGPDVLDAYGSFDFVATDLVPVQLIRGTG